MDEVEPVKACLLFPFSEALFAKPELRHRGGVSKNLTLGHVEKQGSESLAITPPSTVGLGRMKISQPQMLIQPLRID